MPGKHDRNSGSIWKYVVFVIVLAVFIFAGMVTFTLVKSGQMDASQLSPSMPRPSASSSVSAGTSQVAYPTYHGEAYDMLDGAPFAGEDVSVYGTGFEEYADLDDLGRCGACIAVVGPETMPAYGEERGSIGSVKPTGWHTVKYNFVSGKYLYNRCHLIGWQLTAENANERNLITGTRALNIDGMLPFEDDVADYVHDTKGHVLYRCTPVFLNDDLVCRGVVIEALSLDDSGDGISFKVFCHNVQPGVEIDYATGESRES